MLVISIQCNIKVCFIRMYWNYMALFKTCSANEIQCTIA